MKNIKFLILLLLPIILCWNSSCNNAKVKNLKNGVEINAGNLNVKVQFYKNDVVRVVKWDKYGKSDKKSLVVIQNEMDSLEISTEDAGNEIILKSSELIVKISKKTGNIEYLKPDNSTILTEKGETTFKPIVYSGDSGYSVQQNFQLTDDEAIYGLGQHQNGFMNYRGKEVNLVQTNTDAVTPFLVSTQNWGILWDNYSKTVFNDNQEGMSLWSDMGDNIDYYFIAGNNMDKVISGYRNMTGKAPMYGKYAYGYWQSKEHYENRDELLSIAKEYRQRNIPIDNIIQDWDTWEGGENWNQIFFDAKKFSNPKEMIDILHKQNFHIIVSVWCSFGPNTPVYKDMEGKGFLYPTIGWAKFKYFDVYKPEANLLFWDYMNKGFFSFGMDGWWMDSTEPDIVNANTKGATEYELKRMANNNMGSFARYLNTYSLLATEGVYKNQRKVTDKKRVYNLTRSTFAGQQRAAATTWSGDIGASWEIYKKQITAGINHSMSGIPYWTFDIGAFVLGSYGGVFDKGGQDPAYQELYARMFQFGSFCPIFRSHGSETPREIWRFGDFSNSLIKFDNLRYRLMPYIYSLAHQVTENNYSIMRGLAMDFSNDKKTYNIADQFMFGPSIMVCPVTEYMYNRPPEASIPVTASHFKTVDGKPGLKARYYKDVNHKEVSLEKIDSCINLNWYATGRPDYVTDSTLSIDWKGKIIPDETGKYQFHIKCYGPSKLYINGKLLTFVYQSVESYTEVIDLVAGKEYDFALEKENGGPGAFHVELFWKTPSIFAKESIKEHKEFSRNVYLPAGTAWFDFWTGKKFEGSSSFKSDAPIDKIPMFVKAGSIVPMGPFIQYTTEKPADPIELRIYTGADGNFVLYEDENDNYNYEKGIYSTIEFKWNDKAKKLTIGKRKGEFPGMIKNRTINIVLVKEENGVDLPISKSFDKTIKYNGLEQLIKF